jgi:hypothetical protein
MCFPPIDRSWATGPSEHSSTLINFRSHSSFQLYSRRFCDGRGTARRDGVASRVQNLKGHIVSECLPVDTHLDGACESMCLYPHPGSTKNERVCDRAVILALGVPPSTQTGSGQGRKLARGDYGCHTPLKVRTFPLSPLSSVTPGEHSPGDYRIANTAPPTYAKTPGRSRNKSEVFCVRPLRGLT